MTLRSLDGSMLVLGGGDNKRGLRPIGRRASAPVTNWFTDFSTNTAGSPPTGWTSRWAAFTSTNVVNVSGKNVLQLRKSSGATSMAFLSWDLPTASADYEVVVKVKALVSYVTASLYQLHTAAARCQGTVDGTDAMGYTSVKHSNSSTPKLAGYVRKPAANGSIPINPIVPASGYSDLGWQWFRLRVVGSVVSLRTWPDGSTEPAVWDTTVTDTKVTGTGKVGLALYSVGNPAGYDVDCIGVAIDGATAPVAAA